MPRYAQGGFYWGLDTDPQPSELPYWYGADENNQSAAIPVDLVAYQNVDGTVVCYWAYDPIGSNYNSIVWTVQTDTVATFDSGDLATYTSTGNPSAYINGGVHKGMVVTAYARQQGEYSTMYWRVKGSISGVDTAWSTGTFLLPPAIDIVSKQSMLDTLPDIIYRKDMTGGDSNLFKLYGAVGKRLDALNLEAIFTGRDGYARYVRDQALDKNFGALLELKQPTNMEAIDYREILRVLMREAGRSPSIGAIRRMAKAIFGADPDFSLIRDTLDMYVDDSGSSPAVIPAYVDDAGNGVTAGTCWDNANLAFGVVIHINNPLSLPVTRDFTVQVLTKLTPAFAPVYITGI